MTNPNADYESVIRNAVWQFNEAVSLLREARLYVPEGIGCVEEIDESLPAIQEALVALADLPLSPNGSLGTP